MPLREPRLEQDREEINSLLGWSPTRTISIICSTIKNITEGSSVMINELFVYNRGIEYLEDTERRRRKCFMISIWSAKISEKDAECIFQQPVPIRMRFND